MDTLLVGGNDKEKQGGENLNLEDFISLSFHFPSSHRHRPIQTPHLLLPHHHPSQIPLAPSSWESVLKKQSTMATDPGSCSCCCSSSSCCCSTEHHHHLHLRSVKRKLDAMEAEAQQQHQLVEVLARVEVENECSALRETLATQQMTIQDLYGELDKERNASSSAASEALSMILRIQREKAEIQMESRQFKRFAEERMAHDQHQITVLEDAVYKRELAIQALNFEVQPYRHRLLHLGVALLPPPPHDFNSLPDRREKELGVDYDGEEYPSLKCHTPPPDDVELEKYVEVVGNPGSPGSCSINGTENMAGSSRHLDVLEKGVVTGNSLPRHSRKLSAESSTSFLKREVVQEYFGGGGGGGSGKRHEEFPDVDRASDVDDVCERVCTIDAVYGVAPPPSNSVSSSRDSGAKPMGDADVQDSDIKNLYMRLQALEADRETLKQTLVSMRTEKTQNAQLVLLREIAQNLSKGMVQRAPQRRLVRKQSLIRRFSFKWMFKWLASFVFWKKKPNSCKYNFEISNNSIGLLLLLENSPRFQQWRSFRKPQHSTEFVDAFSSKSPNYCAN